MIEVFLRKSLSVKYFECLLVNKTIFNDFEIKIAKSFAFFVKPWRLLNKEIRFISKSSKFALSNRIWNVNEGK